MKTDVEREYMTLEEIALELGITHQSVWQIQNKAITKIRKALALHNITYEEFALCLKHS
jgi:DNA-directed RNA polymerase sigma subunit (sigma70/sigma32)